MSAEIRAYIRRRSQVSDQQSSDDEQVGWGREILNLDEPQPKRPRFRIARYLNARFGAGWLERVTRLTDEEADRINAKDDKDRATGLDV